MAPCLPPAYFFQPLNPVLHVVFASGHKHGLFSTRMGFPFTPLEPEKGLPIHRSSAEQEFMWIYICQSAVAYQQVTAILNHLLWVPAALPVLES